MSKRRVVITGIGMVAPFGAGAENNWKSVLAGQSGIVKLEGEDFDDIACQIAAPANYSADEIVDPKEQRRIDRYIVHALCASDEAIKDSGLDLSKVNLDKAGVLIGTGIGGIKTIDDASKELVIGGPRRVSPFMVPGAIPNMASGFVSMKYGFKGPNTVICTACAAGTHAIGDSARMIQYGDADIMIAGGAEAGICRLGMAGFSAMRAMSTRNDDPTKAMRPWDKGRDGFVMGEGSGIVILEEYEHAKARGAKIYAEVAGFGMSADAHHMTAPAPEGAGAYSAMKKALADAGINPMDVDYINAHGTSTPLNDPNELFAVRKLCGDNLSMSSTKSCTGHLLGAAGAIEAIFTALSIRDQIVPPTINLDDPEDDVGNFDLVPHKAKERTVNVAMSNSFGFGGTNAAIVLKKVE
ncbi:MAG: beta-ketoacyl-ACP synthase II [Alphaproteobacteria bacterium]|nr:beta-ketoacyl-ACP synthase II [Alphaproteobacteria bacterium]